jgi:hypothetical protein
MHRPAKTLIEVTSNLIKVIGKDSLIMLLNKFPENEVISWIDDSWMQRAWNGSHDNLCLPPEDTINEIKSYAEANMLTIQILE